MSVSYQPLKEHDTLVFTLQPTATPKQWKLIWWTKLLCTQKHSIACPWIDKKTGSYTNHAFSLPWHTLSQLHGYWTPSSTKSTIYWHPQSSTKWATTAIYHEQWFLRHGQLKEWVCVTSNTRWKFNRSWYCCTTCAPEHHSATPWRSSFVNINSGPASNSQSLKTRNHVHGCQTNGSHDSDWPSTNTT